MSFFKIKLSRRKFFLIIYDLLIPLIMLFFSLWMYRGGRIGEAELALFQSSILSILLTGVLVYLFFGVWREMWPFAGIPQYAKLSFAALVHITLIIVFQYWVLGRKYSFTIYFVTYLMDIIFLSAIRIAWRQLRSKYFKENLESFTGLILSRKPLDPRYQRASRVLIVGAGLSGRQVVEEMRINRETYRRPVAFVDDNPDKLGYKISGVPVLGKTEDVPRLCKLLHVDEILLAMPSASKDTLKRVVSVCNQAKLPVRMAPVWKDIFDGSLRTGTVREIKIDDLLGRKPISLDIQGVKNYLTDKVVMVTGGGGSIGSELARQIASFKPKALILFDIYENNVYDLQMELLRKYKDKLNLKVLIGSVRDRERLDYVINKYKPEVIFHAAAHKHVPLMEDSNGEAIKNNVYGTFNVADIAGIHGVSSFVLISTDKAVNPTSVMGATKRLAEIILLMLTHKHKNTKYSAVRFGNVLGSNGSVVPLFKKQIELQRVVTVTHPDIVRYFMTIPEASRLVMQAGAFAKGGEIFVLDMGEPVKIIDLARDMIRLSGLEPNIDVRIEFCGLRPGEKLYEELQRTGEEMDKTSHKKIFAMSQVQDIEKLAKEILDLENLIGMHDLSLDNFMSTLLKTYGKEPFPDLPNLKQVDPKASYKTVAPGVHEGDILKH